MPQPATTASATSSDPNFMLSLARGLSVVRAFGEGQGARTVVELAAQTGLSRASVRRCLHTLCRLGYATVNGASYDLTPAVLALGYAYIGSTALTRAAQPVLERIAGQLHESCSMAQLDGDDVVYVARVSTQRILSIGLSVGSRLPASCTSMGRVLIAHLDEAARARYLTRVKLIAYTPRTIVDRTALAEELDRVRTDGYAIVDQEFEVGLRSIAVPVHDPRGGVVAAINAGVQASRATTKTLQREFVPVLRSAAAEIASALDGHPLSPGRGRH